MLMLIKFFFILLSLGDFMWAMIALSWFFLLSILKYLGSIIIGGSSY